MIRLRAATGIVLLHYRDSVPLLMVLMEACKQDPAEAGKRARGIYPPLF